MHEALNSVLTIVMILIENESIICTESEHSLYKKEPGFPITLNRLYPTENSMLDTNDNGIVYRGNIFAILGMKLKKSDIVKIRKAMISRCKEVVSSGMKFEEPINFGKVFQDMITNSDVERGEVKSRLSTTNRVIIRKNKSQLKNTSEIRYNQKIKTKFVNLNKTEVSELNPNEMYFTQNIKVELSNTSSKLPTISGLKREQLKK